MAEYMDEDITDFDLDGRIATYDKNQAEKEIKWLEEKFGPQSEEVKENIRKRYRYVGKE